MAPAAYTAQGSLVAASENRPCAVLSAGVACACALILAFCAAFALFPARIFRDNSLWQVPLLPGCSNFTQPAESLSPLGCPPPLLFPYGKTYESAAEFIQSAPLGCELLRHGGKDEVSKRLMGKHIVFIGDSVLRYQFRSLVYSLYFGHTNVKGPGNFTTPSETWEKDHGTYNKCYQRMQNDIPPAAFQCDCFRSQNSLEGFFENMYYYDSQHNFNLSFFFHSRFITGGHRPLGWQANFSSADLDVVAADTEIIAPVKPADFLSIGIPELVEHILEDIGTVDHVVVSMDHWGVPSHVSSGVYSLEEYALPLENLTVSPGAVIYAAGTTRGQNAVLLPLAKIRGWMIFDRAAIVEPLVWFFDWYGWSKDFIFADAMPHFFGAVYDRFNEGLLFLLLH